MNPKIRQFSKSTKRNLYFSFCLFCVFFLIYLIPEQFEIASLNKFSWTALASAITLLISGIIHNIVDKSIKSLQRGYLIKKFVSLISLLVLILLLGFIWLESAENFAIFSGFFTVGIGVAFQDVFKSIIGSIIINSNQNVEIGSLIEINGQTGRVLNIGFMYTNILEYENIESGGQPIGRHIEFPNSYYLIHPVKSMEKTMEFIWDEINIKLPKKSSLDNIHSTISRTYKNKIIANIDSKKLERFLKSEKHYLHNKVDQISISNEIIDGEKWLTIRYLTEFSDKQNSKNILVDKINELT